MKPWMLLMTQYAPAISPDDNYSSLLGHTMWARTDQEDNEEFGSCTAARRRLAPTSRTDAFSRNWAIITCNKSVKKTIRHVMPLQLSRKAKFLETRPFCRGIGLNCLCEARTTQSRRFYKGMDFVYRLKGHLDLHSLTGFGNNQLEAVVGTMNIGTASMMVTIV